MNERELDALLRMAAEVDQLEDSLEADAAAGADSLNGAAPMLRLVHESAPRGSGVAARPAGRRTIVAPWIGAGAVLAAAACVVVGIVYFGSPGPTKPGPSIALRDRPAPGPVIVHAEPIVPKVHGPSVVETLPNPELVPIVSSNANLDEQCVVLAVFRDARGGIGCVQWSPYHPEQGRRLADIATSELRCISFGPPCATSLQRTILIALSGPTDSIPATDRGAEALARCILGTPHVCADDSAMCVANAASACLPADVTVRVESVASSK